MFVAVVACDAGSSTDRGFSEYDSAGISIVISGGDVPVWRTDSIAAVRIGVVEGEAPYQLHDVRFAGRMTDGRVVVFDGSSQEVRWFSDSGTYSTSFGRRGEGPGEFRGVQSAVLADSDTLVVMDTQNQRLTWLSPDETMVRESSVGGLGGNDKRLLGFGPGGQVYLADHRAVFNMSQPGLNPTRDSVVLLVHSLTTSDSIGRLAADETSTYMRFVDGRPRSRMQWGQTFGYLTLLGASAGHFIIGNGERHQVEMLDSTGHAIRIARRGDRAPIVIEPSDRQRYIDFRLDAARARGVADIAELEGALRDEMAMLADGHAFPPFDQLLVDTRDRIWLRDYQPPWVDAAEYTWVVYDPDGRIAARASLPAALEIMQLSAEHVTGVERDSLDVETVVVYRMTRPTR